MAYSTPVMIRKALVPSSDGTLPTNQTHTAADLSDQQLADAITEADALIDSYLQRLYTVPVAGAPTPHPIDYWSRNIAAYNATLSFRGSQDFADNDPVARRFSGTMEALKAVANGTAVLDLPRNQGDSSAATAGGPINPYVGTLFTLDEFDLTPPNTPGIGPFWRSRW